MLVMVSKKLIMVSYLRPTPYLPAPAAVDYASSTGDFPTPNTISTLHMFCISGTAASLVGGSNAEHLMNRNQNHPQKHPSFD